MPYKWALEYVCDVLSASKTYDPKNFSGEKAYEYFMARKSHYYMTEASKEFISWCLKTYAESGFKGLKKKNTKAKYIEITSRLSAIEVYEALKIDGEMPPLKKER